MSNVNSCEESDASSYSDASVDSDSEEPKQTSKQQNMKEELDVSLDAGQQRKQIFHAIRTGQAEKFSQLTTKYGSVCLDYLDEATGLSCLNLAVQCGRARIVSAILNSYGSKGSERRNKAANATCKGLTPLHLAANFCHSRALISLLAGAEIDWNIRDDRGQTAVHIACNRNDDNIIKLLLAYDWNNKATKKGCKCCNPVSICVSAKVNEKLEKQPWKNMQILRESAAPVNEGQKTLFWKNIPPSQNANKLLTSKDSHDVTPLMLAASAKGSLLKHLREKLEEEALKKAIKMKDHDGNTMLHYAVVSNEAEKIELLVGRGADINAVNSDKSTPLLVASTLGHTKSVIKLLELGASKYTKDKQGRTAMHWCFRQQDTNIYDALMKEASEEENDAEFMTPFHWACRQARQEEAMLMVKKNSKLLGKVDAQLRTGLHWAVLANSTDLVKALLQLKTEPNQPATVLSKCLNAGDFQGKSPLHYASEAGNLNIFKDLVDCGAKLTAIDNDCRTPLHLAVKMGHSDFVKESLDYLEMLKNMSIQIRAMEHRDISGMTCLLIAAEQGHTMLFEHLLAYKADFTAKDSIGRNALMLSVGGGHRDIAKKILDKGLDVNATDVNQNTALHYACKHPDPVSCLDFLLEHGAKLQQNGIEETPLDVALMNQNERAIQLFLSEKYFDFTMSYRKADGYSHMKDFIKHMPDAAMLVLNRSVTKHSSEHADFLVEYNFDHLDPGPDEAPTHKHRSKALLKIVEYKRIELLKHPVTTSLLESKIGITGFIFSLDIVLYLLFLSCLTAFVVLNMPPKTSTPFTTAICFNDSNKSSFGWTNNFYRLEDAKEPFKSRLPVAITLGIRLFVGFIKTLFKLYDWKKIVHPKNFLYATLYALTIAFILPIGSCSHSYNSAFGMFSVAMAWSLLLFIFEYFPVWGIYPAMFQRVVTSLLKVLLMHLYLFVGFSLAFCIGMGSTDMFEYFFLSLLKTFDMTAGELDYVEVFFKKTNSFSAEMRVGLLLFFIVFVIIMPICLVNMLVGIAVGDIDKLTKVASLKMEHYRINIIYDLEDFRRKFCKYIFGCLSCCICAHQRSYSFKMNSTNKAKQCCVCCCYVTDFCTCFYTFKWFKPFRDQKRYRKWLNEYGGKRDPLAKD